MSRTDAQNALYGTFKAWWHSVEIHDKDSLMYNKQLLDEVYYDMKITNYRDIDNFAYHKNRIQ